MSSRIPSPARSQGVKSTPRRYKPRVSRSVGSPARSTSSIKLTTVIQMNSFALSPMPTRRSVLLDTTDINIPTRKSWWKKLDENSREIMEVFNNKDPAEANNAIEEYIEVDVLSQEKKNYTMDIPESSDGESITSIVIPQRKLFTQKESKAQKKFAEMIDTRESLAPLHTQKDSDKTLKVGRKNLFSQGTKHRTKPLFPSALLNISANKTVANKTKELPANDPKGQVKSLFGNRPGTKRKNMFADFIVSDSEDDIPEIQTKVFEFQKKPEQKQKRRMTRRSSRESHHTSPTSSITDIEIDDWKLLPSSTMVDHQLEDGLRSTPNKRARLGKLSEATETVTTESNMTTNKTKRSNKSLHSKSKSKNSSQIVEMEVNEWIEPRANISGVEKNKTTTHEKSSKEQTVQNKEHSKSKNVTLSRAVKEVNEDNVFEAKNTESNRNTLSKFSKTMSKIDQVFQDDIDDNEDFNLVYENDENDEIENEESNTKHDSEVEGPKETSKISNMSIPKNANVTKQNNSKIRNIHQESQNHDKNKIIEINKSQNNLQSSKRQSEASELHNEKDQIINKKQNSSKYNKFGDYSKEEIRVENLNKSDRHDSQRERNSDNREIIKAGDADDTIQNSDREERNVENEQNSSNEDINEDNTPVEESSSIVQEDEEQETTENDENINQQEVSNNSDVTQEELDEELQNQDEEENEDVEENYKNNIKDNQNQLSQDEVDNDNITRKNKTIVKSQENCDENNKSNTVPSKVANLTNDHHGEKLDAKVASPEAILYNKTYHGMESFTEKGRNTTVRKSKSIIKNLNIRPSHASVRESIDFSSGSRNSSAERSGWDSHRTTRATLRQTFGKDFTPRKSLRALVMEKSAKRQTNFTENNAEISRLPQANSTELPGSARLAMDQSNVDVSRKADKVHRVDNSTADELNKSDQEEAQCFNKSDKAKELSNTDDREEVNEIDECNINDSVEEPEDNESDAEEEVIEEEPEINESDQEDEDNESNAEQEVNEEEPENNDSDQEDENNESNAEQEVNEEEPENNDSDQEDENNESNAEQEVNEEEPENNVSDQENDDNESNAEQEVNESNEAQSYNESTEAQINNESDNEYEMDDRDKSREIHDSDEAQTNDEYDNAPEHNDSNDIHEMDESEQEMASDKDESNNAEDTNDSHQINQSDQVSRDIADDEEEMEIDGEQAIDESNIPQELNESEEVQDDNEFDNEQDVIEPEDAHEIIQSDHEEPKKTHQTTLELYLQKVKMQNIERKKQLEEEIRNSLKAPTRDMVNPFKIPAVPKLRRMKPQKTTKAKPLKSSVIPINMLPDEVLQDMKYKPPKRYRPTNASWITKRLYKFLEAKLEPKYDYKARVRSEKLVETIYNFTKDIRRQQAAPPDLVDALKSEMARLDVVRTHFEFYEFFHEYMPREVRVKVVPDVFNKISLPRHGVFSDILRQ